MSCTNDDTVVRTFLLWSIPGRCATDRFEHFVV